MVMKVKKRQETNSITHLVKIVAEEVFENLFDEKMDEKDIINREEYKMEISDIHLKIASLRSAIADLKPFSISVNNILKLQKEIEELKDKDHIADMVGVRWNKESEQILVDDFEQALKWMAYRQSRTVLSIRFKLLELMKKEQIKMPKNEFWNSIERRKNET